MTEEPRQPTDGKQSLNEYLAETRDLRRRVMRMVSRKDRPKAFANYKPEVSELFDSDPEEAKYAVWLWTLEAESRINELDEELTPTYFHGLSHTLMVYGDRLGLPIPSVVDFAEATSTGQFGILRAPYQPQHYPLYEAASRDLRRLGAALDQKLHQSSVVIPAVRLSSFEAIIPEPKPGEIDIVNLVRELDAAREAGAIVDSTGQQLADQLGKKFDATFRNTLSVLTRFCVLANERGYMLGPLASWFCPDISSPMSGQTAN